MNSYEPVMQGRPDSSAKDEMAAAIKDTQQQIATMLIGARKSLRMRAAAIHPDLKPMGFSALLHLSHCGPMHQLALTQQLDTDKAVVSRLIKQLEGLGLISRTVDPADGRAMIVELTPEAHSRYAAAQGQTRLLLTDRLATWEVAEVRRFADLLSRLNEDTD